MLTIYKHLVFFLKRIILVLLCQFLSQSVMEPANLNLLFIIPCSSQLKTVSLGFALSHLLLVIQNALYIELFFVSHESWKWQGSTALVFLHCANQSKRFSSVWKWQGSTVLVFLHCANQSKRFSSVWKWQGSTVLVFLHCANQSKRFSSVSN